MRIKFKNKFKRNCKEIGKNSDLNSFAFECMNRFDDNEDDGEGWGYLYPYDIVYFHSYHDYIKEAAIPETIYQIDGNVTGKSGNVICSESYLYIKR